MAVSGGGGGGKGAAVRAGQAYVELGARDGGLQSALDRAKRGVLGLSKVFAGIGGGLLGAGGGVLAPLLASFRESVKHMADMKDAADRLGTTTEDLSALGYAAEQTGSSLEEVSAAGRIMQRNLIENADEFAKLGLNADELRKMGLADQFEAVADAINAIDDPAERTAAAMNLMGRGGQSMLPMLKELRQLRGRAGLVGAIVSSEDADAADRMGDALDDLSKSLKYTAMSVGASFLSQTGSVETFVTSVLGALQQVRAWVKENRETIAVVAAVAAGVAAAGTALLALSAALAVLVAGASAAGAVLGVVFSPVGLGIAAVGVAIALLVALADELGALEPAVNAFGEAWEFVSRTFGTAWSGIKAALSTGDLQSAFEIGVQGIRVVWAGLTLWLTRQWNKWKEMFIDGWRTRIAEIRASLAELNGDAGRAEQIRRENREKVVGDRMDRLRDEERAARDLKRQEMTLRGMAGEAERAADVAANTAIFAKLMADIANTKFKGGGAARAASEFGSTRGQFGAAGLAASMGIGAGSPVDKIAKNTEDTAKNTKKIADEGVGLKGW